MRVPLTDFLVSYLAADTKQWASFAKTLAGDLASWIPEAIESSSVIDTLRTEMLEAEYVNTELLTYLLSPETVKQLLYVDFRSGVNVTTPSYSGKTDPRTFSKRE